MVGIGRVVVLQVLLVYDVVLESQIHQALLPLVEVDLLGSALAHQRVKVSIVLVGRIVLRSHNTTQPLQHLLSGALVDVELDSHIGIGQVNSLVSYSRNQNGLKLPSSEVFEYKVLVLLGCLAVDMWDLDSSVDVFDEGNGVAKDYSTVSTILMHLNQID